MHHSGEFAELLNSQQNLEFHISRTQAWLAHLGRWKANVLPTDVSRLLLVIYSVLLYVIFTVCQWEILSRGSLEHHNIIKHKVVVRIHCQEMIIGREMF